MKYSPSIKYGSVSQSGYKPNEKKDTGCKPAPAEVWAEYRLSIKYSQSKYGSAS
ncbi:hypothetical protein [Pontibacter kalidii]|uniref:hypothetical protein n=1 Tax=Pontibacter kalidii TaxID=2592049 RepID=UPI002251B171|nr:hypothetical protein [Pontibacter kalidii]